MNSDKSYYERNKEAINKKAREKRAAASAVRPQRTPVSADVLALRQQKDAERKREWALKNAALTRARRKGHYAKERESAIESATTWNRENKARRAAITSKYSVNNPEQRRATKALRRARKNTAGGRFSKADVKRLLALQKNKCAVCTASLEASYEVDHVVPLARGGANSPCNLQILCKTCNRRKGSKDPVTFMQERGFLL
jgi:5-methylcytosine-specific restriction endonuclease McrA